MNVPRRFTPTLVGYGVFIAFVAVLLIPSFAQVKNIFTVNGFDAHGHCFLWRPEILRMYVISDSLIGTSYFAISFMLTYLVYHNRTHHDLPFPWVFLAFGAFIVTCGLTHFLDIWTLWRPTYYLSAYAKFATALASTATAIMLPPLIPRVSQLLMDARLSQERKQALVKTNRELEAEIIERQRVVEALRNSEERLRTVLSSAPIMLWALDTEANIILQEGKALARVGLQHGQQVGESIYDVLPHDTHIHEAVDKARVGEDAVAIYEHGDVAFEARLSPLRSEDGQITGLIAVMNDISDRRRAEVELRKALEKERELNQLKSRFISTMSHEFRTPLSVIQVASELLKNYSDRLSDERKREKVEVIHQEIKYMSQMLDDMLLIGRAESNRLEFAPKEIQLEVLCEDLLRDVRVLATADHHIVFTSEGGCEPVMADERLLRQALMNLLSNAVKYSPEGGKIELTLSCDGDIAIFRVHDEGIGIPKEDLPRLFENFHRASNVGTIPGTGLGSTIAWHAVQLHGGTIEVDSELGIGTTFIVRLPLRRAQP